MSVDKMIEFLENYNKLEDEKFLKYAQEINGLVGPASVEMLNRCVSLIDKGNCYLEIGTFQGMSLIGAAMDNSVPCYGVENFAEEFKDNWDKFDLTKRSNRSILYHNLEKYELLIEKPGTIAEQVHVFEQDYREFFAGRDNIARMKVGVYLYDGPHTFVHQVAGLLLAIPVLANRAIVFVDDYKCEHVPRSIERVLAMNKGYVREIKNWVHPYEHFREGFVALEFNRDQRN